MHKGTQKWPTVFKLPNHLCQFKPANIACCGSNVTGSHVKQLLIRDCLVVCIADFRQIVRQFLLEGTSKVLKLELEKMAW